MEDGTEDSSATSLRPSLSVKVGDEEADHSDDSAAAAGASSGGSGGGGLAGQRSTSLQKQLLWTKRFKTLTRSIDDLYLVCEVERDAAQLGEAIALLRRACTDFQLLHECLGSAQTTPESASSTVSKNSGAISWEVPMSASSSARHSNLFAPSRRTTSDIDDSDSHATPEEGESPVAGDGRRHTRLPMLLLSGEDEHADDGVQEDIVSRFFSEECRPSVAQSEQLLPSGAEPREATGSDGQVGGTASGAVSGSPETPERLSGTSVIEAWKAKRNWGAILVEDPSGSEVTGRTRRRSVCSQLHKKLMSPDRHKKTPQETKRKVDEKQASAQERRMRIESERLAKLAKAEAGRQAAAQAEAERLQALVQDISERHQRSAAQRLAYLDKVSRKAGDQVKKVREVAFIQELTKQDRKLEIQERLEEGEARRQGRLAAVRERQRDTDLAMEQAQERRQRLEEERRDRLARKEEKKAAAQAKLLEERRAEQQAREARAEQQKLAAEERAAAEAKDARQRSTRLEERLREADNRRLLHLETIKERAMLSKEERRDPCTPTSSPTGGRSFTSIWGSAYAGDSEGGSGGTQVQSSDGSITAATTAANRRKGARRRARKLLRQLEVAPDPGANDEPAHVQGAMGTYIGTERCAHWRCAAAKLQRLATEGDTAPLESLVVSLTTGLARSLGDATTSETAASTSTPVATTQEGGVQTSRGSDDSAPPSMSEVELHAVRVGGALDWVSHWAGWPPARGWNKSLQLKLLRLWHDFLRGPESCQAMLNGTAVCGVAKQAVVALEALAARPPPPRPSTPKGSRSKAGSRSPAAGPHSTEVAMADILSGRVTVDTDEMLLKVQLQILTQVLSHVPEHHDGRMHRHGLVVSYLISSGILNGLHSLFALFDRPYAVGLCIPSHVVSALEFMKALTAYPPPQPLSWPLESSVVPGPNVQATVLALKEERLLGLTSFLTGILLRASPDGSVANASVDALPTNFVEIATTTLRVLTSVAMLDLKVMQELFSAPDLCMETYHLVHYLLTFCTVSWDSRTDQLELQGLLEETLMLVGLCVVGNSNNQGVLQWGKSPNIVQLLCKLPLPCFVNPRLRATLMPVMLSACYGNTSITEVMEMEVASDFLLQYLQAHEVTVPEGLPRRLHLAMRFPSALLGVVEQQLQRSSTSATAAPSVPPPTLSGQ